MVALASSLVVSRVDDVLVLRLIILGEFVVVKVTLPEVPAAEVLVDAVIWTEYVYATVGTAS